jgi:hypothetical protein
MHVLYHFAYLDAGTGSLIIQSIIGVAAGVAVFGRRMLASVRLKVAKVFKRDTTSDSK